MSLVSDNDDSEVQHDCFRVTSSIDKADISRQIISYCMYEFPSKFRIEKTDLFPKFTFAELSKQNITSEQLYLWSTPIDIIEDYQFYLDQLLTSNDVILANNIFYNCTLPRFGSMCQYEFDYYHSNHSSLYHIIRDFYLTFEYDSTDLTCYTHLQCNRALYTSCLDWSDICDGKLDCRENGLDEKYCWQMESNECNENEYRCRNGQCIPQSFFNDNDGETFYCSDRSDSFGIFDTSESKPIKSEPSIGNEDSLCTTATLSSPCLKQRYKIPLQDLFSIKDDNVSIDCWSAWKCIFGMSEQICDDRTSINIIDKTCPDMILIPARPILFNEIYFAFPKYAAEMFIQSTNICPYICSDDSQYDDYFVDHLKFIFNNVVCYYQYDCRIILKPYDLIIQYMIDVYHKLKYHDIRWKYTPDVCNNSNLYQCINSSNCISVYRLLDRSQDCRYADDDDISRIDIINRIKDSEFYYYKCLLTNQTISRNNVNDGICDCPAPNGDWCQDENLAENEVRTKGAFPTICDGNPEVFPILIDGNYHTDETECEQWPCNNIYTRCNNIWNCPNGEDETGCYISPILNCSSIDHICVSSDTKQFICLNLMKVNDGKEDCLGAFDESDRCRWIGSNSIINGYLCIFNRTGCVTNTALCNNIEDCPDGGDEQLCNKMNLSVYSNNIIISSSNSSYRLNAVQFLQERTRYYPRKSYAYFSLDRTVNLVEDQVKNIEYIKFPFSSLIDNFKSKKLECHRGFDIRIWLNNKINSTTSVCFCPPSYYGSRCQYQNQRISLSIQFQASSNSWQTLFAVVVSLIDDERMIHSYEQFSYLSARDCNIKFTTYLLYSTKPKNTSRNYSIHIDIYEKISLGYRGSFLIPIKFSFLPVHRLPILIHIPKNNDSIIRCSQDQCIHGRCIQYSNNLENSTFCQCNQGWSGRYCTIPHDCQCSLCIGVDTKNRSVCICPIHRFGRRCLIMRTICNSTCENNGECIPNDEYIESEQKFTCICPRGFFGKRCELIENRLIISFDKDIILTDTVFIHFIQIIKNDKPRRATTFRRITFKQNPIDIYWSKPFHLVFIEIQTENKNYYLPFIQNYYNRSIIINKTIHSSDRCQNISEIFNETIIQLHPVRRIKYYHLPCQLNLTCFYDDIHLCLCQQRIANCFLFNHNETFDCSNQNDCENNGKCFLDSPECPARSICMCPICYYGSKCQFYTSGFALSLDAIIGPYISPSLHFTQQTLVIKITLALTITWIVIGLINGVMSIITFMNKNIREVGCGLYLLGSSITTLLITILFGIKFLILIISQLRIISNRSFLSFQCHSFDFLLRVCLSMDQWLNGCIALERTFTVIKGANFNKKKSKQTAKYVISILVIFTIVSSIYDPIYRRLIDEDDDDGKRTWCIAIYPNQLQIFDSFIHSFHVLTPFLINFLSVIILITTKSRQQLTIRTRQTYKEILRKQFEEHKHILISPIVLIILALPRVIIAFAAKCMKSMDDAWLFLLGYFLSFTPPMLTFIVYILPSKYYTKEFHQTISKYRVRIQRRFNFIS